MSNPITPDQLDDLNRLRRSLDEINANSGHLRDIITRTRQLLAANADHANATLVAIEAIMWGPERASDLADRLAFDWGRSSNESNEAAS